MADLDDWLLRDIGVIRERTTLGIRAAGLLPLGNDMVLVPDRSGAVHDLGHPLIPRGALAWQHVSTM